MADIAFWKGMAKRIGIKLTDKIAVGNVDTEATQYIDVQDLPFAGQSALSAWTTAANWKTINYEIDLGAFGALDSEALNAKLDTLTSNPYQTKYRFISQNQPQSLEIYNWEGGTIQVIHGQKSSPASRKPLRTAIGTSGETAHGSNYRRQ
jgi:hypothetical protein